MKEKFEQVLSNLNIMKQKNMMIFNQINKNEKTADLSISDFQEVEETNNINNKNE